MRMEDQREERWEECCKRWREGGENRIGWNRVVAEE